MATLSCEKTGTFVRPGIATQWAGFSKTASAFGYSVGLSGNAALVGTPGTASGSSTGITNQGAAYVYRAPRTVVGPSRFHDLPSGAATPLWLS